MFPATVRLALNDRTPLCPFSLSFWQGAAVRIEFAIFAQGSTDTLVSDFSNLTGILFDVKSGKNGDGDTLITIDPIDIGDLDPTLTVAQWNAGTHKHGVIELTSDQMSQLVPYGVRECYATIYSFTDEDEKIVHGAGSFNIYRARHDTGGTPPAVPELYYTKVEIDALLAGIPSIGVTESPYVIVDSEAHLDSALLLGKWAVIRGEGNNGVVPVTGQKNVTVRGTKVLGYGYKPSGTGFFGKIKANMGNIPTSEPFSPIIFNLQANDLEFAGVEYEGRDALSLDYWSYVPFYLSPFHELNNISIHDNKFINVYSLITKWGFFGCEPSRNIFAERNVVSNCSHYAFGIQQSLYDSRFKDNTLDMRAEGAPTTFEYSQGFGLLCDIRNCSVEGNTVNRPTRLGIEFMSVAYAGLAALQPMFRNRCVGNIINDANSTGISMAFTPSALIHNNTVNGARYIGIESVNGSVEGENPNQPHSAIITANRVLNVTSPSYATGISCDLSVNDIVQGNHVEGVTSDYVGAEAFYYARGIHLAGTRNAYVNNNHVFNYDGTGILLQAKGVPAGEAQAVVQNNVFRLTEAQLKALYAIHIGDCRAVVRNNISWEPVTELAKGRYFVGSNQGQPVYTGTDGNVAAFDSYFTDTNLVLPYTATYPEGVIVNQHGIPLVDENGDYIYG
jgi:hypothetical protein